MIAIVLILGVVAACFIVYMITARRLSGGTLPPGQTRQSMYTERARMLGRGGGRMGFDPRASRRGMLQRPPGTENPAKGGQ